jgi:hypothetical protein
MRYVRIIEDVQYHISDPNHLGGYWVAQFRRGQVVAAVGEATPEQVVTRTRGQYATGQVDWALRVWGESEQVVLLGLEFLECNDRGEPVVRPSRTAFPPLEDQ